MVVVGGGHNALVAAGYLARAGLSVLLLERLAEVGGAAVSTEPFAGVPARLSRYSYLVSLLPDRIISDLGLAVSLRSRATSSYTPDPRGPGLLVAGEPGGGTAEAFRAVTGSDDEYRRWQRWYGELAGLAEAIAPTLLEPLPSRDELRAAVISATSERLWSRIFERPLAESLEELFTDDLVRGVVATDGLIGTHTSLRSPTLAANRCFLYHVIGNGTGDWRVPVGGMGVVTGELARAAREAGARIVTGAEVARVDVDGRAGEVGYADAGGEHIVGARYVLSGVAPAVLARLRGAAPARAPRGSQLKINVLLRRLPALRDGTDPRLAFAGTFHLNESYRLLETAYADSAAGAVPEVLPGEMYCHSLTDPSILGQGLAERGWQTLTLFGLHLPADLFVADNDALREKLVARYLTALNEYLAEPIESCLARDADGRPYVEARTPLDLEAELGMPGGHIFHGDLDWPYDTEGGDRWGVCTDTANLLLCGSGARRGGGVSGIAGHNAAMALLAEASS
ncbi:MAG: NAD(P)-binding protein [Pseudonocardiaceae bacterium]|nr:NAD(P)-binding protein [Pseudonocardiaceae bacterium]